MEDKIREFLAVAQVSPQVAQQYIEAAKGDVEGAINQYFASSPSDSPRPPSPPKPSSSFSNPPASKKQEKSKERSKISSLADLNNEDAHDHSDEEEGQEFFAGGKASGVSVQGPPTAKNLFEELAREGRKERKREDEQSEAAAKKNRYFGGQGNRLGTGEEPEIPNEPSPIPQADASPAGDSDTEMEELNYTLTFWEDGFSVDDGPLRDYKDPANEEFLKTLREGRVPRDLQAKFGQPVNVTVKQRIAEKYVPPKKVLKPFSGAGNRLGSEIPGETTGFSSTTAPAKPESVPSHAAPAAAPSPAVVAALANMNEQLTTVQIRLADGTRMVTKFNPTQTVGDVIRFINMSRAGESQRNYVLMTTFPNREYTDLTATLEASGLLNAVVVQRYK